MALYIHRDMSLAAMPPTPRVARKLDPSLHPSGAGGVQMGRGAAKGVRGVLLGGGGGVASGVCAVGPRRLAGRLTPARDGQHPRGRPPAYV